MTGNSYDVRIWQLHERADTKARYRVRWRVDTERFTKGFVVKALADAFRAQLLEAARKGESFSTETGLPLSITRRDHDVSCYEHADDFVKAAWQNAAAKSRVSWLETLRVALPALTCDLAGTPKPDVLRLALGDYATAARNIAAQQPQRDGAHAAALRKVEECNMPVRLNVAGSFHAEQITNTRPRSRRCPCLSSRLCRGMSLGASA
ncbi:MAG: hypothetical protein ACLQDY_25315 [Streptosporangiaceae bacterium]